MLLRLFLIGIVSLTLEGSPLFHTQSFSPEAVSSSNTLATELNAIPEPSTQSSGRFSILYQSSNPIAVDDAYITQPGVQLTVNAPGVLANDTPVGSNPLTATALTQPSFGTLALNQNGSFVYTPNPGFIGRDTFLYQATETDPVLGVLSATATVTITVDNPPHANNGSYQASNNRPLVVPAGQGLTAIDPDVGQALTFSIATQPTKGILSNFDSQHGSFTYIPNAGTYGLDTFTFFASDGLLTSNTATVQINVNYVPVAINVQYYMNWNSGPLTIGPPGLSPYVTDPDLTPVLTFAQTSSPLHGTITGFSSTDGSFTYAPAAGFHGTDSFNYTVSDGIDTSNTATVSIYVNAVPVASNHQYITPRNTPLVVSSTSPPTIPTLLALVTDADANDILTIEIVTPPGHGAISTFNPDTGTFTYTPAQDYFGLDQFTYRAKEMVGGQPVYSNEGTITVFVNYPPSAINHSYMIPKGSILTQGPGKGSLLDGVVDLDTGETLTVQVTADLIPGTGTVVVQPDGSFVYTPPNTFYGSTTFKFKVFDGSLYSAEATVTIRVNYPPVAAAQVYSTSRNLALTTVKATGVLLNVDDKDTDEVLTAQLVSNISPAGAGSVSLNPDGSFTFTPTLGYIGDAVFQYQIFDGSLTSPPASATIHVINHPPTGVSPQAFTVTEDTTLTVPVNGILQGAADPDPSETLTAMVVSPPLNASSFVLNPDGSFVYTPKHGFPPAHADGLDSFTFQVSDNNLTSQLLTVNLTVKDVNDPPQTVDILSLYTVGDGGILNVGADRGLLANGAQDPEGDTFRVIGIHDQPLYGTISWNPDGSFIYQTDLQGTTSTYDTFTYVVQDNYPDPAHGALSRITKVIINRMAPTLGHIDFISPFASTSSSNWAWIGNEAITLRVKIEIPCNPNYQVRFYRWDFPQNKFVELGQVSNLPGRCDAFELVIDASALPAGWNEIAATLFDSTTPADPNQPIVITSSDRQFIWLRKFPWNGPIYRLFTPLGSK